jgi:Dna[CI] antecedent, DciA
MVKRSCSQRFAASGNHYLLAMNQPDRKPFSYGRSLDSKRYKERWTRGEEVVAANLGEAMQRLLSGTPLGGRITLADPQTLAAMEKAWGANLSARCEPIDLSKGVLTLKVREPSWRYELGFRKGELVKSLYRESPTLGVRDLRFVA